VRFAEEGADIIAVDLCAQIESVSYAMAQPEDLDETVNLVEKTGRRILAEHADVRDFRQLQSVVDAGEKEFGRIDFVLANAGIAPGIGQQAPHTSAYLDAVNVMLNGVYFTVEAAVPALLRHGDGGAIVITSSAAGLKSASASFGTRNHGAAGYTAAKHGTVGLMRYFAATLAEKNIRVNSVHPNRGRHADDPQRLHRPIRHRASRGRRGVSEPLARFQHRSHRRDRGDDLSLRPIRPIHHRVTLPVDAGLTLK